MTVWRKIKQIKCGVKESLARRMIFEQRYEGETMYAIALAQCLSQNRYHIFCIITITTIVISINDILPSFPERWLKYRTGRNNSKHPY